MLSLTHDHQQRKWQKKSGQKPEKNDQVCNGDRETGSRQGTTTKIGSITVGELH
jgi:hypothetical protein